MHPPRRVRGAGGRDGAAEPRKGGGEFPFAAGKQAGGLETASPLKGRRYWKTQMDGCMPVSWGIILILPENGGSLTDGEEKMTKMPMELLFGGRHKRSYPVRAKARPRVWRISPGLHRKCG